jgi:hypothetical protein
MRRRTTCYLSRSRCIEATTEALVQKREHAEPALTMTP